MRVYTIWESEDEGFRMPSPKTDYAFSSLKDAMDAVVMNTNGWGMSDWKEYQDELCIPNCYGDVMAVYSDDAEIKSVADAVALLDGDKERLYCMDWTFVMGIKVV